MTDILTNNQAISDIFNFKNVGINWGGLLKSAPSVFGNEILQRQKYTVLINRN